MEEVRARFIIGRVDGDAGGDASGVAVADDPPASDEVVPSRRIFGGSGGSWIGETEGCFTCGEEEADVDFARGAISIAPAVCFPSSAGFGRASAPSSAGGEDARVGAGLVFTVELAFWPGDEAARGDRDHSSCA